MSEPTTVQSGITQELLNMMLDAYNAHDVDAVMGFFAEDAIFDHAMGSDEASARPPVQPRESSSGSVLVGESLRPWIY